MTPIEQLVVDLDELLTILDATLRRPILADQFPAQRAVLGEQRDRIMSLRCEFAKLCDPAAWYLRLVEESGRDAVYDAKLQAL